MLVGVGVWLLVDWDEAEVVGRQGLVTNVVDGDTLRARIGGSTERVRLIGVDAPERGECNSTRSTELLRELAQDTVVTILGDSTQRERDRFGRLLAYVVLPDGIDAGRVLLERGAAVVFETRPPFARHDSVRRGAGRSDARRRRLARRLPLKLRDDLAAEQLDRLEVLVADVLQHHALDADLLEPTEPFDQLLGRAGGAASTCAFHRFLR